MRKTGPICKMAKSWHVLRKGSTKIYFSLYKAHHFFAQKASHFSKQLCHIYNRINYTQVHTSSTYIHLNIYIITYIIHNHVSGMVDGCLFIPVHPLKITFRGIDYYHFRCFMYSIMYFKLPSWTCWNRNFCGDASIVLSRSMANIILLLCLRHFWLQ